MTPQEDRRGQQGNFREGQRQRIWDPPSCLEQELPHDLNKCAEEALELLLTPLQ